MTREAVVVDTNMIFSALISKHSRIRSVILESEFSFYSPNYLFIEIFKNKEKLLRYSHLSESDFYLLINDIIERINLVPLEIINLDNRQKAYDFCKNIDIKDTVFVALSLELGIPLWTGDKKLIIGLKAKGFDNFFRL